MNVYQIISFVACLVFSGVAYAGQVCISVPMIITDSGVGETNLASDGEYSLRGARADVIDVSPGGSILFSGFLDLDGCTNDLNFVVGNNHIVSVHTEGYFTSQVPNQDPTHIIVRDFNSKQIGALQTDFIVSSQTEADNGYSIEYVATPSSAFSTFIILANFRFFTPFKDIVRLRAYTDADALGGTVWHKKSPQEGVLLSRSIYINGNVSDSVQGRDDTSRKFIISHEAGHDIIDIWTSGAVGISNISYGDPTGNCDGLVADTSHSIISKEFNSAALDEGFSHYISALAWNDISTNACFFRYWNRVIVGGSTTPTINCNTGSVNFSDKYLETNCTSGGLSGKGVELDWMRFFWDFHMCGGDLDAQRTLFENSSSWGTMNAYTILNNQAQSMNNINTCWNQTASSNGIQH